MMKELIIQDLLSDIKTVEALIESSRTLDRRMALNTLLEILKANVKSLRARRKQ